MKAKKQKLVQFYKVIIGICPECLTQLFHNQVNQASPYNLKSEISINGS